MGASTMRSSYDTLFIVMNSSKYTKASLMRHVFAIASKISLLSGRDGLNSSYSC
jgi:hypothetical protein